MTSTHSPSIRRLIARSALAVVLTAALVGGAAAAPASAVEGRDKDGNLNVAFQTYWGRSDDGHRVKSIGFRLAGHKIWDCRAIDAFNIGPRGDTWASRTILLQYGATYDIVTYADAQCNLGDAWIGSQGRINTRVSQTWTVYNGRPPVVWHLRSPR